MRYKLLTLLVILLLTACQKDEPKSVNDILGNLKAPTQATGTTQGEKSPVVAPTTGSTPTVSSAKTTKVVYSKNEYGISRQVAIAELAKGHYFESITSEVEGFRSHFYRDSTGNAIGNGYNASFQTRANNVKWATAAGISPSMVQSIASLSNTAKNPSTPVPRDVVVTPAQASSLVNSMRPSFQSYVEKYVGLDAWSKLTEYQKAVLAYHVLKVGPGGAAKYKGLYAAVRAYAANPTVDNAKAAAAHIEYSYQLNGQTMHDHRSQLYMGSLFVDPEAYKYLLGTGKAPAVFNDIAAISKINIDTSKPADIQVQSQDTFGNYKDEAFSRGEDLKIQAVLDGKPLIYQQEQKAPTGNYCMMGCSGRRYGYRF